MSPNLDAYQLIVENSLVPAGIIESADYIVKAMNKSMASLLFEEENYNNKSLKQLPSERIDPIIVAFLDQVYQNNNDFSRRGVAIYVIQNDQLLTKYYNVNIKCLVGVKSDVKQLILYLEDITESINFQRSDLEIKERLAFSLKSAGIGIWDLDPINKTVNLDSRCRILMGLDKAEDANYVNMLKTIHRDDVLTVGRAIHRAMDPKNSKEQFNVRFRTVNAADKQVNWVHCIGYAYLDHKGRTYRFSGIINDINAEVESRAREEQMLSLISHNANSMLIADIHGKYLYMNDAARNLLGINSLEDISKFDTKDFFYDLNQYYEIDKQVRQKFIKENVKDTSASPVWMGNIVIKNLETNEPIPIEFSFILIRDPNTGKVISRGGIARDLRPEIKIKVEQQRLNTIIDSSEDFINYCDIDGNILYINTSGKKLIGLESSEYLNKTLFDYHSKKSVEIIKNEVLPKLYKEGKWSGRLELYNPISKEIIPIHKQFYLIKEEISLKKVGIGGIGRDLRPDINAHKAIKNKNADLQNAIRELEFLANTVPSTVWTSNPEGEIDFVNQRWFLDTGSTESENYGHQWSKNLHPDDKDKSMKKWEHSIKTGDPYDTEFRFKDKNGNYTWYLVRAMPLRDESGKIVKWYGSNTNIQMQKELEKQKDDFLGVASHELKTPVTSLKAYAQIIEAQFIKAGDKRNAEILGKMNKQINRLTSLISDLLDVTKLNSGKLQFNQTDFNFNEMVEEAIEDVAHTSPRFDFIKNLNFKGNYFGDRDRIFQVITNFLTNAVKYSPNSSRIVITSEIKDQSIVVSVQDFGIGIKKELSEKVFEQFYRVTGPKEITYPGLGLGLFVSAEIIRRMKGYIWVNSVVNEGSIFGFSLPIQENI